MNHITQLLGSTSNADDLYAWLPFVCAATMFAMGVAILIRERGSRVGVIYLFQVIAIAVWLLGFGVSRLASSAEDADGWIKLAHVGISFIPAISLQFTWSVIRPDSRLGWLRWVGWIGAGAFAIAGWTAPGFFGTPYLYSWGYYAHYTAYSTPFILFLAVFVGVALELYRRAYRSVRPESIAARRAKLLYISFAVGAIGAVDFIPAYGVDFYAFGYVPVLIGIGLITYITGRYRLMDITPAFAAKQILETMNDGLFMLDEEGVIQVANDTLLAIVGATREELIGRRIPGSLQRLLTHAELASIRAGVPMHNREIDYTRRDGTALVLSFAISAMRESRNQNAAYVCIVRDITERKRAEQRIRTLAYYDNLTGLPNRQLFQEQLHAALASAARNRRMVALLFLDVDYFKRINDTLGHALGDSLLQVVAGRLLGCVRKIRIGAKEVEDTVARLGGDEFIVALYDLDKQDDVRRVAERILAAVSEPLRLDHHEIAVTASLGISVYPHDGDDVGALLKNADAAMYRAKEAGRNCYFFYDASMNANLYDQLSLQAKLRRALEQGSLSLKYQPQVVTHTRETVGVEALLRWNDPELGWIPPERFIPIAEESGLILPIGKWALKTACVQARAWQDAGLPMLRIAVNLSSRQFRDRDLPATVREALDSAQLEPDRLELELTESMVMHDALQTRQTLDQLRAMGVHLSIDDFGTGYSSLSYLRSFPIDTLKIDRSFIQDIVVEPDSGAIVAAIIAMARSLKLRVIAEGVETEAQHAFLQQHGCKLAQGALYCEPLSADALEVRLRTPYSRAAG